MNSAIESSSVLVTGATGFIGHHFLRNREVEDRNIIALLRPGSRLDAENLSCKISVLSFDLNSSDKLELPGGIDTIFHLAGKAHSLAEVRQDEAEYARINTAATCRLLEAAKRVGVRAFVYFSSVKAVGDAPMDRQPVDESWDAAPDTAYGSSKRKAEMLVLNGGFVPHPVVIRPCLVYGKGAKGNLEKMVEAVRVGRFPAVPEFGNRRSMVHVADLVSAAVTAASAPQAAGRTYIVADNQPFSTRQLYEWIRGSLGLAVPRATVPLWSLRALAGVGDRIGKWRGRRFVFDSDALAKLTGSAWVSSARIQRELGWLPRRTLQESLSDLVERPWRASIV